MDYGLYALVPALIALPLAVVAAALSGLAWYGSRGRTISAHLERASEFERTVVSNVQGVVGRIESCESLIRSLSDEAQEAFDRAEKARKRAAGDLSRLARETAEPTEPTPEAEPTDRAGQIRLVVKRLAESGQ